MYILTNVSQDTDGKVYAGMPTLFATEGEAVSSAREQLADDFGIALEEVGSDAQEGGTPYVLSMSRDGRFEAYTVSEKPRREPSPGVKRWLIGKGGSEMDDVEVHTVIGTEEQVKKHLCTLVKNDRVHFGEEGYSLYDYGTESPEEVQPHWGGRLYAYGCWSSFHIDYTATQDTEDPVALKG